MYRIRRESGEEVTFGSVDEFGAAVAAGQVTAKAEIFHARAEKWLPIASHPHFKMAQDRISSAAAPKPSVRAPGITGSGQRPALGASGQRPVIGAAGQRPAVTTPPASAPSALTAPGAMATTAAPRATAPQLRVVRQEATASAAPAAPADASVAQKSAPRWSAQHQAARAVAPKPSAPAAPPASDLRLVRGDTLVRGAARAPAPPEVEFELLPAVEPAVIEPVASEAAIVEPVGVAPAVAQPVPVELVHVADEPAVVPAPPAAVETVTVVERAPAALELVSREERPAAERGEVEIINPDRTMPVVSDREIPSHEIPAPISDFAPIDAAAAPVAATKSKAPLFIGVGLAAAAAAVIGFFALKPSSDAPKAPSRTASSPAAAPVAAPSTSPSAPTVTSAPKGASTGLGGDVQPRKAKKAADGTQAAASIGDGLEPPPDAVLPAAPKLGRIGDAAALPTVDAGVARNDAMARAQALEKTRREIDSSMRSEAATR